jgi:hypothetical protein
MKVKRIVSIWLSGVAASAGVAFPSYAQGNSEINQKNPVYECQQIGDDYVTVVNVNNQSHHLIEWSNNNHNIGSNLHRLIPNPKYVPGENSQEEPMIPVPDENHVVGLAERCRSVSLRLDNVNNVVSQFASKVTLLAGKVPPINLRDSQGNVLIDSKGNPFQSAPWVICATSQVGETCTRENMLFTLGKVEASEANQLLNNFIALINNPGEFQAIKL